MKNRWIVLGAVLLVAGGFFAGHVVAEDGDAGGAGMQIPDWVKPAPEHEAMKKFLGSWDVEMKWGPAPAEKGVATWRSINKGLYLAQDYKGKMMGRDYVGHQILGYDTVAKEWFSLWIDSFSPVPYVSRGTAKDGVTTLTGMTPSHTESGKKHPMTTRGKWDGDDKYLLTFHASQGGKEMQIGSITYTRQKK